VYEKSFLLSWVQEYKSGKYIFVKFKSFEIFLFKFVIQPHELEFGHALSVFALNIFDSLLKIRGRFFIRKISNANYFACFITYIINRLFGDFRNDLLNLKNKE
jgi:hypothetical protein